MPPELADAVARLSQSPVMLGTADTTTDVPPLVGRGPQLSALSEALGRLDNRGSAIVALRVLTG